MKVIETGYAARANPVHRVRPGTPVKFVDKFRPDMNRDTVFMVLSAPCCYYPEKQQYHSKVPVVDIETGGLSYVMGNREVRIFKGEVRIEPMGCC